MSSVIREERSHEVEQSRRDLITGGLGVLLVAGVFTDGWAHFNRPGMESFFTPWHAALYSALGVMGAWLAFAAWRASGGDVSALGTSLPAGYGLAVVGAATFGLGGATDLVWHQIFGVEVAIDALISPTHLLLGAGGILILATGMRSQGVLRSDAGSARWSAPATLSLVLSLAMVVFFLLYTSAFPDPAPVERFTPTPEGTPGHREAELPVVAALSSYLLTTVVIALPVLLMNRAGSIPRGGVTLVVATVAILPVAVVDFPAVATAGALGAVLGAFVSEVAAQGVGARLGEAADWVRPASMVALVWVGQLGGLAVVGGLGWPASLLVGVVVLTSLLAGALGFLSRTAATS